MGNKSDLMNQRFGKLLVIGESLSSPKGDAKWKCLCACGKISIILSKSLKHGMTKSCGCLKVEHINKVRTELTSTKASMKYLMRNYKRRALKRNLQFCLDEKQFEHLTSSNCHYCGVEPKQKATRSGYNGNYIYNGIDRKDNNEGYIIYNCTACCKVCNRAKNNMLYVDFLKWIDRIKNNDL